MKLAFWEENVCSMHKLDRKLNFYFKFSAYTGIDENGRMSSIWIKTYIVLCNLLSDMVPEKNT